MVTMTQKDTNYRPKIALYEPDIPQNTAAIIRTCSCLGANLEIIEPCGFIFSDRRFQRVVMDYINMEKIKFYKSAKEFFDKKKDQRIILMTTIPKKLYTEFKFKKVIQISNLILAADVSPEVAGSSGFNMIASFFAAALLIVIPAAAFLIFVSQKDSLERTSATRRR